MTPIPPDNGARQLFEWSNGPYWDTASEERKDRYRLAWKAAFAVLSDDHQEAVGRALAIVMSEISERNWCAGWDHGLEYRLWAAMQFNNPWHPRDDVPAYARNVITHEEIVMLRTLSDLAGGWVIYGANGEELIALAAWERQFAEWLAARK